MKTTILKSVLIVLMALFSLNANAYDVEVNGIYYNVVKKTKVATVTHWGEEYNGNYYVRPYSGDVIIPASFEYEGVTYSVKAIGEYAFWYCGVTSVSIPDGVTSIGCNAFGICNSLTSVKIPNSVMSIGPEAFSGCI